MTSTFVASSTGLRRRYDQPNGRLEINGKSSDFSRSAWAGAHSRDFADIDVAALVEDLHVRLEWAKTRIDLPAGRYETILPPTAVADLMIYAYWTASARDAEEGRNVFAGPDGATRIGERLSALPLTLRSDPSVPGPGVRAVRRGHRVRRRAAVGVRQRGAGRGHELGERRDPGQPGPDRDRGRRAPASRPARWSGT